MIRSTLLLTAVAAAIAPMTQAQAPLTIGNLAVLRVGDGSGGLTSAAAPMFLDEYTTSGVLVQTIALPTVSTSGGNRAIVVRGSSTSEGRLDLSSNGVFLTFCGYEAMVGTPSTGTAGESSSNVPRVIGRVDLAGNVDTTTAITDGFDGAQVRSVTSDDGFRFWVAANAEGTRFVANLGDTTSLLINAGQPTNLRSLGIFDGQLYVSSGSNSANGVIQIGDGLPTTINQAQTVLPGFNAAGSPYDFYFADSNTVYVADDLGTTSTISGIEKWTFVGGSWSFQYRLAVTLSPTSVKVCRGLTGFTQDGVTTLFATTQDGFASSGSNQLMMVVDTGMSSVPVEIANSPSDTRFRGIRYIGKPTTITRLANTGCSNATYGLYGNGQIGTDIRTKMRNSVGFPFTMFGVLQLGLPLTNCTCVAVTTPDALVQGADFALHIPNNPSLIGAVLLAQGLDVFDPAASCAEVSFATLTDGFQVTVQ